MIFYAVITCVVFSLYSKGHIIPIVENITVLFKMVNPGDQLWLSDSFALISSLGRTTLVCLGYSPKYSEVGLGPKVNRE